MDSFLEVTLDISRHYGISVDVCVNEKMKVKEFIYETLKGLELTLISIDNIVIKVKRSNKIITQSEVLEDGRIRNGDVLILM
ncbi:MAG: hypothetical protein ACK5KR_07880 [Breznakia sp.]